MTRNISARDSHNVALRHRADIDGLRAVAIVSVLVFHASPGRMTGDFTGVDIFFVISVFLISTLIFKSVDENSFGTKWRV